jgi:hypothetical protein
VQRRTAVASTQTAQPEIDDAFWDIVSGDADWVRDTFDAIVAAGWDAPPPPPAPDRIRPHFPRSAPARPVRAGAGPNRLGPARDCGHNERSPPGGRETHTGHCR